MPMPETPAQIAEFDQEQALAAHVIEELADQYDTVIAGGGSTIDAFHAIVCAMMRTISEHNCGHPEHVIAHACELVAHVAIRTAQNRA